MAQEKRKRAAESDNAHPPKKSRPSKPTSNLIAPKEEPAFQRGGASILTPLEKKQIQTEANRDALFEQTTGQKARNPEFEGDEHDESLDIEQDEVPTRPKANTKAKRKRPKGEEKEKEEVAGVRIEGLSYKRLVPGSLVLGQVSQINRHDIALALPNNLTGFVPLTSVSEKFTELMESVMAEDDESEDADETKSVDPHTYFVLGQYLRAYVVSTTEDTATTTKGKRHIELSIDPRQANGGLSKADLVAGSMVQASVNSVEDHGLVMNLGLEDLTVRGFIPSEQIGKDVTQVKEGAVLLCLLTEQKSNSNIFNLCADPQVAGDIKKHNFLTDAPSVDSFIPGTAVEILISEITPSGIAGKAMGLLDVTADCMHSGVVAGGKELAQKYKTGSKVKGRLICTFPHSDAKKIGISLLDHVISLRSKTVTSNAEHEDSQPLQTLPLSKIISEAKVVKVEPGLGLFLDLGVKGIRGFVHISKIADKRIDDLSESTGRYKLNSVHRARVIGYNAMDGLYIVSMEEKVLSQPFLRVEDVEVGQVVKGTIGKVIVGEKGVTGLLVELAEGIRGLVPDTHFADVRLQTPEKKFKEGMTVTARVLSTNLEKRQIRLTLKKTLVNSDIAVWKSYDDLSPGMQAPGTIVNILSAGAVVQFYGPVKAFLPVSEMSESYIDDPKQHFRVGQVVTVHISSVDPPEGRMIVSCKDPTAFTMDQQKALQELNPGTFVQGTVSEKTSDEIILELEGSRLKAILQMEHLVDGSVQKSSSSFKRIRVGQDMKDLLLLSKQEAKRLVKLTSKPSLVKAAKDGVLLVSIENVVEGSEVQGFVKNVSATAVFVQFAGELTGMLPKSQLSDESARLPGFGLRRSESITCRILSVDYQQQRFFLTKKTQSPVAKPEDVKRLPYASMALSNPVDETSQTLEDYSFGKVTKARIVSVKDTQLNVQLADRVQGRIDVSEMFDGWAEMQDKKQPLRSFHKHEVLPVRILGMHDSRNHRFLPITHRDKAPVFELTAKPKSLNQEQLDVLTLDKVQINTEYIVFVNNIANEYIWVNLSPNVRGRIKAIDVSDNVSMVQDLAKNFPVGRAIKAKAINIDVENNRLDLSARTNNSSGTLTFQDVKPGMVLPGKVTKVTDRQVMIQLSDKVSGPVYLVDLADDYSIADPTQYHKYLTVRVYVKDVDSPNKRLTLSTRPSKVLSSSLPVQDPDISSLSQLKVNDVYRGFIKNVADNGVFVSLACNVTAYIKVTDLSDSFLKDWKDGFEVDQLVRGKIIAVDTALNHVQMSLRESHVNDHYKAPLTFNDLEVGQAVAGKVRKVVDFGVFIVVDDTANISGLCHRSEISDEPSANPVKLYEEGDTVKAKILKIDPNSRKISFGLKASYFTNADEHNDDDEDMDSVNDQSFAGLSDDGDEDASDNDGVMLELRHNGDNASESDSDMIDADGGGAPLLQKPEKDGFAPMTFEGLSAGFDWTGNSMITTKKEEALSDTESVASQPRKKRRRKAEIKIDRTGDLDANGPQSVADFERLLLGQPNSSMLWLSYMAFQLELSEVDKAREVAERALKTINMREQDEKLNVWVALLNLENTYGNEDSLKTVFKRACQYNDSQDMHERLLSIYIQSGSNEKADELFQTTLKKHTQSPSLYLNYATFLMTTLDEGTRARALLPRALQSLPPHTHLDTTSKFAQLEFSSLNGDPERGRTMFEGLVSTWPKRLDLWNVLLDLELKQGENEERRERVRSVFERIVKSKLNVRKAKWVFKRWLQFEEQVGDVKGQEKVQAKAAEFVKKLEKEKAKKATS